MSAISISHLSFKYQEGEEILSDISFDVEEGDFICLLGANGSGKSTLAKVISGLLPFKNGEIKYFDEILNETTLPSIRKKIGIVFQNPDNQFIASSVEDDIAFGLENRCVDPKLMKEMVFNAAKEVGMEDYLKKEPTMLSGGQKQRVAIAGVIVLSPSILILDEATSMLDPKGKKDVFNLLLKMRKDNPKLTIISITHDVNEAMLANRIIVLNKGKIIMDGNRDEIFSNKELLEESYLKQPFFYKLKFRLIKEGYDVSSCSTLDEIKEYLCQLK